MNARRKQRIAIWVMAMPMVGRDIASLVADYAEYTFRELLWRLILRTAPDSDVVARYGRRHHIAVPIKVAPYTRAGKLETTTWLHIIPPPRPKKEGRSSHVRVLLNNQYHVFFSPRETCTWSRNQAIMYFEGLAGGGPLVGSIVPSCGWHVLQPKPSASAQLTSWVIDQT